MTRRFVIVTLLLGFTVQTGANQPRGVLADLRTLATAIESYRIDHLSYPPSNPSEGWPLSVFWLTTPIPYLNSGAWADSYKRETQHRADSRLDALIRDDEPDGLLVLGGGLLTFALLAVLFFGWEERRRGKREILVACGAALIIAIPFTGLLAVLVAHEVYPNPTPLYSLPNTVWTEEWVDYTYHTTGDRWILQSVGPDGDPDIEDLGIVPLDTRAAAEAALLPHTYDPTNGTPSSGDIFWTIYGRAGR